MLLTNLLVYDRKTCIITAPEKLNTNIIHKILYFLEEIKNFDDVIDSKLSF